MRLIIPQLNQSKCSAWPAYIAGTDLVTVINDYDKARQAWREFYDKFDMDIAVSPGMALPAKVYSLMDYKLYSWPGHGLPPNAGSIQFAEGEYMKEDEYNLLIHDPSDFWMRTYIPRVLGAFESWKFLNPFTSIIEMPAAWFMPCTRRISQPGESGQPACHDGGRERIREVSMINSTAVAASAKGRAVNSQK